MGFIDSLAGGIGSAAGGLLNMVGGAIAAKKNLQAARETNRTNLQLAREQNQWNLEQWNRENAYNSPANQVQLLKDAGLNPNLYGGAGSTAGQLQSADLANQIPATMDNPLAGASFDFAGALEMLSRAKLNDANAERAKAGAALDKTRAVNEMTSGKFIEAIAKSQLDLNNSTITLNDSHVRMNDAQADVFKKKLVEMDANISALDSACQKNLADVALSYANISALDQRLQMEWKRLELDQETLRAQKELWKATQAQLFSQMRLNEAQRDSISLGTALQQCTFGYQVEGARLELGNAQEGLRHLKVVNETNEKWLPYEKGVSMFSQFLGTDGSCAIGLGALKKAGVMGAAGYSILNPSSSVAMPR